MQKEKEEKKVKVDTIILPSCHSSVLIDDEIYDFKRFLGWGHFLFLRNEGNDNYIIRWEAGTGDWRRYYGVPSEKYFLSDFLDEEIIINFLNLGYNCIILANDEKNHLVINDFKKNKI